MALDEAVLSGKEVRLFPSHHVTSDREAELRATASLLAVASAVSEFGKRVVSMAGGPGGKLRCYTEVPFKVGTPVEPREERPDGILRAKWGKKDWTALVEVKIGDKWLEQDQFDRYHTLSRDHGVDALITISNESSLANGLPPRLKVNGHLLKKVSVIHLSWARLLSEAQLLIHRKNIADSDQQWILEEWIRYLVDPQSRIIAQPQLGQTWNEVLRCARESNLSACESEMRDVVQHWDAFLKKMGLRLRAKLGVDVEPKMSRAEQKDPELRIKNLLATAINDGQLSGAFAIPDTAGDLSVVVLLKSKSVQYSVDVGAPTEGKAATRIKWILKQLVSKDVPDDLIVQVDWGWRLSSQAQIGKVNEQVDTLLWLSKDKEVPREALPRSFSLQWTIDLPKGKARSTVPVLEGIAQGVEAFYKHVVEGLRPYVPKAPQLHKEEAEGESTPHAESTKQSPSEPETPVAPQLLLEREEPPQGDISS